MNTTYHAVMLHECLIPPGLRAGIASVDLSEALPEEIEEEVREAAEISMGTEV